MFQVEETPIDLPIDPRLLSGGMLEDEENVNQDELDNLENLLFLSTGFTKASQNAQLEEFATQAHLINMDDNLSTTDFIGLYSTINVSTNTKFARASNKYKEQDYDGSIGPVIPMGNSRDPPIPFVLHCKVIEGCTFETIVQCNLTTHEMMCTQEMVEKLKVTASLETKFECTHCHQRFKTRRQLRYHFDVTHLRVAKRCDEEGCNSTEVFANSVAFNCHKTKQHTERFPTRCVFPQCTSSSA